MCSIARLYCFLLSSPDRSATPCACSSPTLHPHGDTLYVVAWTGARDVLPRVYV